MMIAVFYDYKITGLGLLLKKLLSVCLKMEREVHFIKIICNVNGN